MYEAQAYQSPSPYLADDVVSKTQTGSTFLLVLCQEYQMATKDPGLHCMSLPRCKTKLFHFQDNRLFSHCFCTCVYRSRVAFFLDNRRGFTQMGQADLNH